MIPLSCDLICVFRDQRHIFQLSIQTNVCLLVIICQTACRILLPVSVIHRGVTGFRTIHCFNLPPARV